MKLLVTVCFCSAFLVGIRTHAQRPFITIWNTGNPGASDSNQIIFRGTGTNYNISWINTNDSTDTGSATANGTDTITFATKGYYQVAVTPGKGTFTAFKGYSYNSTTGIFGDAEKLLSVEQWGDIHWTTFDSAFANCIELNISATDIPDLSKVTDMSNAFLRCISLVGDSTINSWDVSHVTNMQGLFSVAESFNQPIGNWNVSNVTNMSGMFLDAQVFNRPIGNWNVSNVTDMSDMFEKASKFNQPIGNWSVSHVTTMIRMFFDAQTFNQPLDGWDVSNVINMGEMFRAATNFNQPIGKWNVSHVRFMGAMFNFDSTFNQPTNSWDVSHVIDMGDMFFGAISFNQPIENWNVSNVTDMSRMFGSASVFNQPLNNWNVSSVVFMNEMFRDAVKFNQPIGNWNVRTVYTMDDMFYNATIFNQPINSWNVSNVYSMKSMFQNAKAFNQPLDNWNVSNVNGREAMFSGATSFNQPIGDWDVSIEQNMNNMFNGATAFNQPLKNWNVSHVNEMHGMFDSAFSFNQDINDWNVAGVYDMSNMFKDAYTFNQDISKWNVSKIENMSKMFQRAKDFNQSLGNLKISFRLLNITNMLDSCGMDCNNYSHTLKGWASNPSTNYGLILGAANLSYDSAYAKAAHDSLTTIKRWEIIGDKIGHCSVTLPVSFISFTAQKQNATTLLQWQTANEINNNYFGIERSADSKTFTAIGTQQAFAKSNANNYFFVDSKPLKGINYYHLKQVDKDGKFTYSKIVSVSFINDGLFAIAPNPANNFITITILSNNATSDIFIYTVDGQKVLHQVIAANSTSAQINIGVLKTGVYNVVLLQPEKKEELKLVKK